jgi:hypothetical protein
MSAAILDGPWFQDGLWVWALNEKGLNCFSTRVQDPHTPEDELIAVARLMKAAPDLLHALYTALPYVEDTLHDPCCKPVTVRALKLIHAALKQAQ